MKEYTPKKTAAHKHDPDASIEAGHDPLRLFLIQHIGYVSRYRHIENTCRCQGPQKAVGQHTV